MTQWMRSARPVHPTQNRKMTYNGLADAGERESPVFFDEGPTGAAGFGSAR